MSPKSSSRYALLLILITALNGPSSLRWCLVFLELESLSFRMRTKTQSRSSKTTCLWSWLALLVYNLVLFSIFYRTFSCKHLITSAFQIPSIFTCSHKGKWDKSKGVKWLKPYNFKRRKISCEICGFSISEFKGPGTINH